LSIPVEWLPLFSHCVGFGFFVTITTRRVRYLGALALIAFAAFVGMYSALPSDWVVTVTNSAGYTGLAVVLVLALACRAAAPNLPDRTEKDHRQRHWTRSLAYCVDTDIPIGLAVMWPALCVLSPVP
jgi:hypothetical protein